MNRTLAAAGLIAALALVVIAVWQVRVPGTPGRTGDAGPKAEAGATPAAASPTSSSGSLPSLAPQTFAGPARSALADLMARAPHDAAAAEDLGLFVSLCSLALDSRAPGKLAPRFRSAEWWPWVAECDPALQPRLMASTLDLPTAHSPELERLLQIESEHSANASLRDQLALDIIVRGVRPTEVATAAFFYFHPERLARWSDRASARSPAEAEAESVAAEGFRVDLALLLGCRAGRDCSGSSAIALFECAATDACSAGTHLEDVVAMRRSPQEMRLMEKFIEEVLGRSPRSP